MDVGTEVLLDESTDILLPSATDVARKFSWAFEKGIDGISQRIRLGKFAKFFYDSQYTKACRFVHDYIDVIAIKAAERAKERQQERSSQDSQHHDKGGERYTFLKALAATGAPPKIIRDQVLNTCKFSPVSTLLRVPQPLLMFDNHSSCCARHLRVPYKRGCFRNGTTARLSGSYSAGDF